MRSVSRLRRTPWIVDGPEASAARIRARLVIDLEPGIIWSQTMGPLACGASQTGKEEGISVTQSIIEGMCGRFVLFTTGDFLIEAATTVVGRQVVAPQGTPGPRYNLAPTQIVPIVRIGEEALLEPARWGLLPHWKKDDSGPPLFNARAETIAEKPSFRDAFKHQRCLIPMDGYYEWHEKKPFYVSSGSEIMWAAGLWARGLNQLSTTMVTTDSVEPISWLHNRLPRFLSAGEIGPWLTGTPDEARELLHPTSSEWVGKLSIREVSSDVGNVRNDHAGLLD